MSNFASWMKSARAYAKEHSLTLMQQDYEKAIIQAESDDERLAAATELLSQYERGVTKEGALRLVAWLVLAGGLITAVAMLAMWGKVELPGRFGTITETNWAIIFAALGTFGSALITTLILMRIADAMDLFRMMNLRQVIVRLERKGVTPWFDQSESEG